MTNGKIKIEVISELTGDPKSKVAFVVNLMRDLMKVDEDYSLDEELSARQAAALRRKLKKDKELLDWYKQGLRYCQMMGL
ncbi:MAG: hypothetical protein HGB33_06695 [Syntrophaceae bacterium]|nr:hypothetical protein [Syntrophaceae bacterium]